MARQGREGSGSDQTLDNDHAVDEKEIREISDSGNQQEKGQSKDGELRAPVGFWDKRLSKTRRKAFLMWARTVLILSTFILLVLSLYWACLYSAENNLNSLIVYVVNFETDANAMVGPLIVQETERQVRENSMPHLGFVTMPPSAFNNSPVEVRQAIYNQDAWASIVINANATSMLRSAVETGNSSYDPLGACQVTYLEARQDTTYFEFIYPEINTLMTEVTSMFGEMWTREILQNTTITRANLERAPQALSPAIGFSIFNLRPFLPTQATPSVTIGLIYLIIIAFFSFIFFMPVHMLFMKPKDHPPVKFSQIIIWRLISTISAYFFMSLAYSLVSLAFQIPFSEGPASQVTSVLYATKYGHGSFVVYWMLNFVGMIALGLACENMAMLVGQPWTSFWLIFWVISNVSTAFYSIETEPAFFYWGYAWPLHNIVEASRTIVFDLHSRLGLNFGILFAWCAVNVTLFPFCCLWFRKQMMKEQQNKD